MDKNIERLKKYLGKADDKLKEAGIEYKPERGDFSSDRSKVAGIVAEAYSNAVENCFRGNDCDEVLGGYDILDELMSGKSADELKDEICSHVVSDFLVGGKGLNEDLEESYFGPAQHPQLRFHTRFEVEADPDYPKESDFLDEDGDIDYVAYDDAVDVFIRDNYGDAPILDAEKEDALKDDIFAFNKKINPYDFSSTPSVSVQPSERSGFIIGVKDISAVLGNSVPKNIQEFLDALKKKYGLVDAGEEALGSNRFSDDEIISTDKIAGIVPMDILDEGYLNQNVSDFIELCRDLTKLDHIIVYPSDSEKPIFDSYEDWPGSEWVNLLGFGDFSCGGAPVRVTVGDDPDEITSRWYPTLGDFLDDANVDDAVVYDVDGNVIYKGPKDGVPEDILFMPFISYDAPAVLVINSTTTQAEAEELSSLDESKKKRKGKDGIAVHLNAGNPKKNMAFLNMSLGSDGFQGGMACCGGSATGGEGQGEGASIGENASENKAPTADCKMEEGKPIVKPLSARARKRAEFAKASVETRRAENERRANNTVLCPDMDFGEMQDFAFGYNVEIENTGVKGKYRLVGHPEDVDALKRELKSNGLLHETAGGDDREKALRKAFNLIKRKGCYAVIYAYTQGNGSVFLNPPLCKDSQEEVQKFVDAFKRGKQSARAVVDVLYKSQVDKIDTFDELIGKEAMAESRKFMGQGYRTINVVDNSKVDEMNGDELERMPDGTEKYCIRMLNSMIAYDWDRKETAKEFLDRIEGTHTYEYIKKYIDELGKDKVAELMQRQIDDVDRIVYAGTDSEGTGYNSIIWKDSKRESLKPRRLAGGEATGKANEDTEKLKDGRWANVGKDGKVDSGKFKTKKQADAQRRAIWVNWKK